MMRRLTPTAWIAAVIGVGAGLGIGALANGGDSSPVRVPNVNDATKAAEKWASAHVRTGERYEVYGCEGDEVLIESRFACHVRFTMPGREKARVVTVYVANTQGQRVIAVRAGERHLPYGAAVYEKGMSPP